VGERWREGVSLVYYWVLAEVASHHAREAVGDAARGRRGLYTEGARDWVTVEGEGRGWMKGGGTGSMVHYWEVATERQSELRPEAQTVCKRGSGRRGFLAI
jgi:sugar lactone lactonase YvrE